MPPTGFKGHKHPHNILAQKFPEVKDVSMPDMFPLTIFGPGSFVGEDDLVFRDFYSGTMKSLSQHGLVYELRRTPDDFVSWVRSQDETWLSMLYQTVKKDFRRRGDWI